VNSTPDTKAKMAIDLTPQIAARAYELSQIHVEAAAGIEINS